MVQGSDGALEDLGFQPAPWDPCVWVLRDPKTRFPVGVIGLHVDDGLCGGGDLFQEKLELLHKRFAFGSRKSQRFTFTGIELSQRSDGGIVMNQSAYVRAIKPVQVSQERRKSHCATVTADEKHALRAIIGSLQYAAVNTRPDLCSRLSMLQSSIPTATVDTLLEANRALHEAKSNHDVEIQVQPIAARDVRFLAFCDASFASKRTPDSHAGSVILTAHRDISRNQTCAVSPICWSSKKIQKVVTSTLAAETVSMGSMLDQLSWLKLYWAWLLSDTVPWRDPNLALSQVPQSITNMTLKDPDPHVAATDCRSLFDLLTKTAAPNCSEFRTQLQARAIRDLLGEGVQVRWVHSGAQLADSLTKVMGNQFLREVLRLGTYQLADEREVLKTRATNRDRLRWLKQQDPSSKEDNLKKISAV